MTAKNEIVKAIIFHELIGKKKRRSGSSLPWNRTVSGSGVYTEKSNGFRASFCAYGRTGTTC